MHQLRAAPLAGFLIAAFLVGCATPGYMPSTTSSRPDIISAEEIARSSSTNVWDLLRKRARMYNFAEDRYGRPRLITTKRGASTINVAGSDSPLVLVDGARLSDVGALRDMPTDAVDSIELQSGISGTSGQGTNAVAGVIYIHTKEASSS
ncbi:MAG TPA: TonB-dependent receptor plug domain-containing protein [Gemmatimonadaceae bacterium]|nr:TonB-dependent receptor plug domain-containing protein [Gemmatimonadaceae bacterium]